MQLKSKKEAAELLGVSTRALERAVRRGHLVAQYRPSKHGPKAWFSDKDLDRYKHLQLARAPLGFSSALFNHSTESGMTVGTITTLDEARSAHRDAANKGVPLSQRLVLSFEETIQFSGLPRQFILTNIRSKKLKVVKIADSLYVKRAELEAFVRKL